MAESRSTHGTNPGSSPEKPIPPPMQSVIKGGWTYRIEDPIETAVSALKELAAQIRTDSWAFVRYGPRMLSPGETRARQREIIAVADDVEKLAVEIPQHNTPFSSVTQILHKLHTFGFFPNALLIENVARSLVSAERFRRSGDSALNEGERHGR